MNVLLDSFAVEKAQLIDLGPLVQLETELERLLFHTQIEEAIVFFRRTRYIGRVGARGRVILDHVYELERFVALFLAYEAGRGEAAAR